MRPTVAELPSKKYCPNGHRWVKCKGLIDVDDFGYRAIKCECGKIKESLKEDTAKIIHL